MRKEEHIFTRAKLLVGVSIINLWQFWPTWPNSANFKKNFWVKSIALSSTLKIWKSKKHCKNCKCCPVSLFIARSLGNGRSPSRSIIRGRSVDFYTLFVEPDRQIVLIIMTISVEMVYEKKHSNNGFKTFISQDFQTILSIFLTHQTTRFPTISVEQQIEK